MTNIKGKIFTNKKQAPGLLNKFPG